MKYKWTTGIMIGILIMIGISLISTFNTADTIITHLKNERTEAANKLIKQHEEDKGTIKELMNQNAELTLDLRTTNTLLNNINKSYIKLKNQKTKKYEEVYNANDSNHIEWFKSSFPE